MRPDRIGGDSLLDPEVEALFAKLHRRAAANSEPLTLHAWRESAEAWLIADALERAGGNRSQAARALGIGRRTLYNRIAKLGIDLAGDGGEASGSSSCVTAPAPAVAPAPFAR